MNSVEQKSFDNGIMRLVGLTKYDYVAMILTQAFAFVLPSIFLAFVLILFSTHHEIKNTPLVLRVFL